MMYLQVVVGFAVLLGAAELLVRGAVTLAERMGISPLVIGMTVIALGTSAPELVVSMNAALEDAPGLAIGNIIGSNIANIWLILGTACIITPIVEKSSALYRDAGLLMGGSLVFAFLCAQGALGQVSGTVLVALFLAFLASSYWRETADVETAEEHLKDVEEFIHMKSLPMAIGAVVIGIVGLAFGSDLLVEGGVDIAREAGVSEEVIGLTLFAFGTSLPELAASVVAAYRGHSDVAVGNVVGSNIFNMLGIAGIVAVVVPLPVREQLLIFDVWVMLAATAMMLPILLRGWRVTRHGAVFFLALYGGYIAIQVYGVTNVLTFITG